VSDSLLVLKPGGILNG